MKVSIIAILVGALAVSPCAARDEAGLKALEKAARKAASALAPALAGKVVVADLSDLSQADATSEFGQKAADLLEDALTAVRKRRYQVVERRELIKIMRDSMLLVGEDADAVKRLQKEAGMDVLVSGAYSIAGAEISLTVKAVDAATGKLLASATRRVPAAAGLKQMLAHSFSPSGVPLAEEVAKAKPESDLVEVEAGLFYEGGDGRLYPVRDGMVLTSHDNYAVYLRPKAPCYVYVYQADSTLKAFKLFPNPQYSKAANPLPAAEIWLPGDGKFLYLDEIPGREELYVFATREPAPGLEQIQEAKLEDIKAAIRKMGVAGARVSESVTKVRGTQGDAVELVARRLAAQGGFFYRLGFIHQARAD